VTKADFVERLAGDGRFESRKQAGDALDAVLVAFADTVAGGGVVNLTGFGNFSVADRAARQGVNPRTGERITIQASRVPKFSAGAALKAKVKS
jgi:DNA-binding protein HU-beta